MFGCARHASGAQTIAVRARAIFVRRAAKARGANTSDAGFRLPPGFGRPRARLNHSQRNVSE
jgi:hypothetical protein